MGNGAARKVPAPWHSATARSLPMGDAPGNGASTAAKQAPQDAR